MVGIDVCRRGGEDDERARSGAAVLAAVTFESSLLLLLELQRAVAERRELIFQQTRKGEKRKLE